MRETETNARRRTPSGRPTRPTAAPRLRAAKTLALLWCLLLCLLACTALPVRAAAPDAESQSGAAASPGQEPNGEVRAWLERLRDTLPEGADELPYESAEDVSRALGLRRVLQMLAEGFSASWPDALRLLCLCCGLAMLGGAARMLSASLDRKAISDTLDAVCAAVVGASAVGLLTGAVGDAAADLRDLCTFGEGMWGVFAALLVSGGNTASAAVGSSSVALWLTLCETAIAAVLLPLCRACLGLALVSALTDAPRVSEAAGGLKRLCLSVLGALCAVFSASVAFQTAVASAADTAALRGARYALGQMIPTVGPTVSGALSTLAGSLSVIRGAVGGAAVIALLSLTLPQAVRLLLLSVSLSAAGGVSSLFGFESGKRFFAACRGACDLLLAALILALVSLLVTAAVFLRTGVAAA
ncbi:MAG: hypothetical protein J6125_00075 [Clostridia bacterium]|nr:hypothetical protein [Clostridia bacterium]